MKKNYFFVIIGLLCGLSSCVDIVESYNFKPNGNCSVAYNFDMSRAVSVLMNLIPDSVAATQAFSAIKDTSMNYYNALPDSTQAKLTPEEVKLAKASNLSVIMNLKRSQMKVSISHEAANAPELEAYLQNLTKLAGHSQFNKLSKKDKNAQAFNAQQLIAGQDCYSYQVTPHKFCRIIDKDKFNAFVKKTQSTFAMARAMLIDMPYKVVLNFAKPVKKLDNPKAVLSADRHQVTLQTSMDEIIKNPTVMNLQIDF